MCPLHCDITFTSLPGHPTPTIPIRFTVNLHPLDKTAPILKEQIALLHIFSLFFTPYRPSTSSSSFNFFQLYFTSASAAQVQHLFLFSHAEERLQWRLSSRRTRTMAKSSWLSLVHGYQYPSLIPLYVTWW
jgi:hypothetical protein